MKTVIKKWGDSFVVRIPDAFANKTGLGSADLSVVDDRIIIKPVLKSASDKFSGSLNKERLHTELDNNCSKEKGYPDITQTRTWELCGSLEIPNSDTRRTVGHDELGRIITDYAEYADEVLMEDNHV